MCGVFRPRYGSDPDAISAGIQTVMIRVAQRNLRIDRRLRVLLRETWQPFWDDELSKQIIQWRYYDRPATAVTWLVLEGERCIAMLIWMCRGPHAQWRAYRGARNGLLATHARATQVWHRPVVVAQIDDRAGTAVRARWPEPTMAILPKLKWTALPSASSWGILPIKVRGLTANLIRQKWWNTNRWPAPS